MPPLPLFLAVLRQVFPRTDLQQLSTATRVKGLARWLVQRRKAVFPEQDDAITPIHSLAHHLLLTSSDSCAHQHATRLSAIQPLTPPVCIILISIGTVNNHCHLLRIAEKEAVAHQLASRLRMTLVIYEEGIADNPEQIRVQPLDGQSSWVVIEVVFPVIQLPIS